MKYDYFNKYLTKPFENPAPSRRHGQIHLHDTLTGQKYYFEHSLRVWYSQRTGIVAPRKYQKILQNARVMREIIKAEQVMGIR